MNNKPKVSIGLPVYNGEKYVAEAISSILNQTYTDFELVITDNTSTDRTREICEGFAERDSRVIYHRLPKNIGAILNFERVYELANRGEYFKWAAADDVIEPTFLEKCVRILDTDPTAVLAYSKAKFIDKDSKYIKDYKVKLASDVESPISRFHAVSMGHHKIAHNFEIFGLIRRNAMDQIPQQGRYAASDRVYVARIALFGKLIEIPEFLFLSREHPEQSIHTLPAYLKKRRTLLSKFIGVGQLPPAEWFDPKYINKLTFPEWRMMSEYFTSLKYANLSFFQKVSGVGAVLHRQLSHNNWARMARDFLLAADKFSVRLRESFSSTSEKPKQPAPESEKPRAAA